MTVRKLNPKTRFLWIIQASILSLILGTIIFAGLYSYTESIASAVAVILFVGIGTSYGIKRYGNWGFEVRDDHLYIEHGVIRKVYSMVPYVRVQHIDTDRGPLDRILGLSTLRVYTAGSKGADIKIPGLAREEASELQKKLRDSAISSEKGFDAV